MESFQIIGSLSANRFIRLLVCVIALSIVALVARAGPCDISWDGDKVAANSRGYLLGARMRLLDKDKNVNAEVTVAQVMAFYEAKEAISRVVGRTPSFVVCNGNEPNAFAMKGNNGDLVGVTVGMMKLTNGDRDMAATIIGHEYGHHLKNHASEGETRDLLIGILGVAVGAVIESKSQQRTGVQGLGFNLGQLGATLVSRKFSRDQEREADELGFSYMVSAGFNPNGAIRLTEQMQKVGVGGIGLFFDSHPGWQERGSRFRTMIASSAAAKQIIATGNYTTLLAAGNTVGGQAQTALTPTYETNDAEKSFNDGLAAWRRNDMNAAVREFRSAADAGFSPAQIFVGWLYQNGRGGLQKSETEAIKLFRLAADQGNSQGQVNLGSAYETGIGGLRKDGIEAKRLYRLAADQGNTAAIENLQRLGNANSMEAVVSGVDGIAGSTWEGFDGSPQRRFEMSFMNDGKLRYKYMNGANWSPTFENGTWKQNGTEIYIEMNSRFAEYKGRIVGSKMSGTGWNMAGLKWTWSYSRKE